MKVGYTLLFLLILAGYALGRLREKSLRNRAEPEQELIDDSCISPSQERYLREWDSRMEELGLRLPEQ
jgi:hypothetical protein